MLLKWSVRASLRGWHRLSAALMEIDLMLSGLGGASRRIRREQKRRRGQPRANLIIDWPQTW